MNNNYRKLESMIRLLTATISEKDIKQEEPERIQVVVLDKEDGWNQQDVILFCGSKETSHKQKTQITYHSNLFGKHSHR